MSKLSVEYGGMVSGAEGIQPYNLACHPGVYERCDIEDHATTVIVDDFSNVFTVHKKSMSQPVSITPGPPKEGIYKPAGFAITFRMLAP